MRQRSFSILLALGLAAPALVAAAPRLSTRELGGFLKLIAASAGASAQGRMDCLDDDVAAELKDRGVALDVRAPIAYADGLVQVRTFSATDKLIVCGDKALLRDGATVAIVKEAGKPVVYIDSARKKHFEEAGITFSDVLLKIAKVL